MYSFDNNCHSRLISTFDFAKIYNETGAKISLVVRLADRFEICSKYRHPSKLIVIVVFPLDRCYISVVDVRLNCVVNTIDFPYKIKCAEVILSGAEENIDKWPLIKELSCMNGVLALGTQGGQVLFVDLNLDSSSPVPLAPKKVTISTINISHVDIKSKRRTAIFNNQVLCVLLNAEAKCKNKFVYREDSGKVISSFLANEVYVTALHYIPQLSLFCVGFNFGGFQLYNLNTFNLESSCGLDNDLLDVVSFAFQMPENDPKNFSYLWVVRGLKAGKFSFDNSSTTAFIYMLSYENCEYIPTYGILYNTFKSCSCKFQMALSDNLSDENAYSVCSSKLVDMFVIPQISGRANEDENVIDTNLALVAWQTQKNDKAQFFFLIFDLNQWYVSQFPPTLVESSSKLCPFISVYSLGSHFKDLHTESVKSIYLHNNSLNKFRHSSFYLDIHSYPCSLSFDVSLVINNSICKLKFSGFQKQVLSKIIEAGPSLLTHPEKTINESLEYGLILPDTANHNSSESNTDSFYREALFNIALENKLTSFIINTIKSCSIGENINLQCDLKTILNWIWNKVHKIKTEIDFLTQPLFNCSGLDLSPQDKTKLVSFNADLRNLCSYLKHLQLYSQSLTEQSLNELQNRQQVVELIRSYLEMILICENSSLLPEYQNSNIEAGFFYSYDALSNYYSERREKLMEPNEEIFKNKNVLLIDCIVNNLDTPVWSCDSSTWLYPPPNIHSLLRMFLIDSIDLFHKECIMFYFLLDYAHTLKQQNSDSHYKVNSVIDSLCIGRGIKTFLRGIWLLDNKKYDSALQHLTHPSIASSLPDLKQNYKMFDELIQRVVELFLFDYKIKNALFFSQNSGQFLLNTEQNEDLYIQMLLLNNDLTGAFNFQRQRRSELKNQTTIYQIFFICEKMDSLVRLCQIPMDPFEEKHFVEYLLNSNHENAKNYLVLFFVLNNKLLEAISFVKENEQEFLGGNDISRNIVFLMQAYSGVVPSMLTDLTNEIFKIMSADSNIAQHANSNSHRSKNDKLVKIKPKRQKHVAKVCASTAIEKLMEMNEIIAQKADHGDHSFR